MPDLIARGGGEVGRELLPRRAICDPIRSGVINLAVMIAELVMCSITKAPPGGRAFLFLTENVSADGRCLERRDHIRRQYYRLANCPGGFLLIVAASARENWGLDPEDDPGEFRDSSFARFASQWRRSIQLAVRCCRAWRVRASARVLGSGRSPISASVVVSRWRVRLMASVRSSSACTRMMSR